ncbi:MAG: saccharopine dehydrogenase family protein [Planctomycetes bacterium]|nr:saccharopine dehydrogenase family protein [Planctomycetota bacterium]
MTKAIVLGCGLVGATMARDLAADEDFDVAVADVNAENLKKLACDSKIETIQDDLSDPKRLRAVIEPFDIVIGGLPSRIGFQTLRTVIEASKPYCDISFTPEDAMELDGLAKKHGVTAVIDCGVSPGLSNMIVGYVHAQLDTTHRAVMYVGGLPKVRHWPYEYKAPFAPSDVIEEYTRPARFIENGLRVTRPALSEAELIDFPKVGTLEAFNTDGLRTMLSTLDIPNMKEKTLRYPGHIALMRALRETGFFRKDLIDVGGVKVRPLDVTSKLLFAKWSYEAGEEEFTVLRVIVEGEKGGEPVRHTYDLYDEYDRRTETSSMARTTAFPNVIVARMIASGAFHEPGVIPPERLGARAGLFDHMVRELSARGVTLVSRIEKL